MLQDGVIGSSGAAGVDEIDWSEYKLPDLYVCYILANSIDGSSYLQPDPTWKASGEQTPGTKPSRPDSDHRPPP